MNDGGFHLMVALYMIVPPAALLLLIGIWLYAMIRLRGCARRVLALVGTGVFALAMILFGGQWLLQQYGLAWRFWVRMLLAMLLWCAGLAAGVLTAWYVPRTVNRAKAALRGGLCAAAAVCLVIVMLFGTVWGGFWVSPVTEEVTVYRDTKVVGEKTTWLDYVYVIYEYKGPFVRGDKPIGPIGG